MKKINVTALTDNFFETIGKEWMLVTAGTPEHYNMMTASWGGIGWLWNKPVAFVFVRPERYTDTFIQSRGELTLSFLGMSEEARKTYALCGSKSGRDVNKVSETGLMPITVGENSVTFQQARLTLECKTLYADDLKAECFADRSLTEQWYGAKGGFHRMYIAEITGAWMPDEE